MLATAYADPITVFGSPVPIVGSLPFRRSRFGDIALVAFLLAQILDGIFTYIGVTTFGIAIEANPIVAALMTSLGHGAGLFGAKLVAGVLGVCLHLKSIHRAVAVLALFYFTVAVGPWTLILFL